MLDMVGRREVFDRLLQTGRYGWVGYLVQRRGHDALDEGRMLEGLVKTAAAQ